MLTRQPFPMMTAPETYQQMAQAIAYLRQHHRDQPDLKTIAAQVHLSEHHFQRRFTQWAGISPKRFVQYLTLDYAKSKLAESPSLLALSADAGLSSPGRLHDLFVTLEAMSPGEFKQGGQGLRITYGLHGTPFGHCLVATTTRGICNLQFLEQADRELAVAELRQHWPQAELILDGAATEDVCDRLFWPLAAGLAQGKGPIALHLKGTNFQIQVWRALLKIPLGELTTYQGLAQAVGKPKAARAIGNAVGKNPVGFLIPCHRVIRGSGELGGYRWGTDRKAMLLGWEASQVDGHCSLRGQSTKSRS